MTTSKWTAVSLAVAGALLALASIAELPGEATPYVASGMGEQQRFEAIISGAFRPAASRWSRDLYLGNCLSIPGSVFALAQPGAARRLFLETCRDNARTVLRSTPNASNAWLVLATTSAALKDFDAMRHALAASKRTAPNLRWLAERRTRLAEANLSEIDAAGRFDYADDIGVLATGGEGIAVLARRYAQSPELRDAYVRVIEGATPEQKRAFLDQVRLEMSQ